MARIEDLEDVGYRVKYDDEGNIVGIFGNRGEPSPFVLATTNKLTGGIEYSAGGEVINRTNPRQGRAVIDWSAVSIGAPTSGWTCEKSYDKTIGGLPTLKVTATAGAADTGVIVLTLPANTFFGGAQRLGFGICPTDPYISGDGIFTQLWVNTTGGGHRLQSNVNASHVSGDFDFQWSFVNIDAENIVAGQSKWATLAVEAIPNISMVVNKRNGNALAPMYISPVIADPAGEDPSILTLFFDGTYAGQYNFARQILSRNNFKASLATIVPRIGQSGSYMTQAQMNELGLAGHEFICHTGAGAELGWDSATKYPDGSEYALVKADLNAFKSWCEGAGFSSGKDYAVVAFTNGLASTQALARRNNISQALIDSGVKKVRQLGGWAGAYYGDSWAPSLTTPMTSMVTSSTPVGDVQALIDKLIARRGSWHAITMHDIVLSGATANSVNVDIFRQIIDYIAAQVQAGKLYVMTFSQAMTYYRNKSIGF